MKTGRFPSEVRALPIMEQAFVMQSAIQSMEDEVEAMSELKRKTGGGSSARVNLKALVGSRRR